MNEASHSWSQWDCLGGQGGFLGSGAGCMHCIVRLWKSFVWSGEAELSREWVVWRVEKAVFHPCHLWGSRPPQLWTDDASLLGLLGVPYVKAGVSHRWSGLVLFLLREVRAWAELAKWKNCGSAVTCLFVRKSVPWTHDEPLVPLHGTGTYIFIQGIATLSASSSWHLISCLSKRVNPWDCFSASELCAEIVLKK